MTTLRQLTKEDAEEFVLWELDEMDWPEYLEDLFLNSSSQKIEFIKFCEERGIDWKEWVE